MELVIDSYLRIAFRLTNEVDKRAIYSKANIRINKCDNKNPISLP